MAEPRFAPLNYRQTGFLPLAVVSVFLAVAGVGAALYMESYGHIVTGMSNRIVWGLPHVFAVMLIVAASGALNLASLSSVLGKYDFKPLARLSGLSALALLSGGLAVLVLDLGRPDRLFITLFHRNLKSVFAWNIYLYSGFFAIVGAYLFVMMDRNISKNPIWTKRLGTLAFVWRLILTTGTGSIFGFLIARELYDSAILAPLLIASSLQLGLAFKLVLLAALGRLESVDKGHFRRLLILFLLTTLALLIILHVTKLYAAAHVPSESFLLWNGGGYSLIFWLGQVGLGLVLPLVLLFASGSRPALLLASGALLLGGIAQFYTLIIAGQAWPLTIFPGMNVSSSFYDGQIIWYSPSVVEVLLGLGGVGIALTLVLLGMLVLPILPKEEAA
ncbi:MAG: polysulfide reductase NrfD [Alphaproteobacteria bacterium]|nr:polysulfide reductase NrfD [Alphaproteobacteria bacterium]MDE2339670.1 polysulfide reductase NrfD [Alphaproteobacteria bacterium]